jgi:hypothetical protein
MRRGGAGGGGGGDRARQTLQPVMRAQLVAVGGAELEARRHMQNQRLRTRIDPAIERTRQVLGLRAKAATTSFSLLPTQTRTHLWSARKVLTCIPKRCVVRAERS